MRKREKAAYIIGIAAVTAIFTVITKPSLRFTPTHEITDTIVTDTPTFRISAYDSLFRTYADTIGWDWKMLAAIAYVESKFDTAATSNVGAQGLMQMMPGTARAMGVPEGKERDPEESVRAAVNYFAYLSRLFRRIPESERIHFVLASYNAGFGHIQDAMRLARKYGKDRFVWFENVDSFLILKSEPEYYTDSLCRNGVFNGWKETLYFVKKVHRNWGRFSRRQKEYSDSINRVIAADSTKRIME
jgi:membrane-bound lytic murein transglycosylase F